MKRPRPYIPISVRIQVAERQILEDHPPIATNSGDIWFARNHFLKMADRLKFYLGLMFKSPQLDHDPALILRKFNLRTGKYNPDANDPDFLIYRECEEHQQKTTGRAIGASRTVTTKGSDIWLKSKFNRLEGRLKPRKKAKIPQRINPWPKRKFK